MDLHRPVDGASLGGEVAGWDCGRARSTVQRWDSERGQSYDCD